MQFAQQSTPFSPRFAGQQQQPQSKYAPWSGMSSQAYGSGVNAQTAKDQSAFNAAAQLGVAGQNAMGQYGMSQQQALVNSQIAQANAMGQMGNAYYNTMGQLGQYGAGLGAAGAMAASDTNKANAMSGALGGLYQSGGFNVSGPEGTIASGSYSAPGGGGGGFSGAGQRADSNAPVKSGFSFLNDVMRNVNSSNSGAGQYRRSIDRGFQTTQRNLMDPGVRNAMMSQMQMGYGALDGLYGKSDWGFNTGAPGVSQRSDRRSLGFRAY